jgi:hypothetical protein
MTNGTTARAATLTALEPSLGPELIEVFDELLPDRRWRDSIRIEQWERPDVREAVAAHSKDRRHLHEALVRLLGEVHAGTLMEYLVPAPWTVLVRLGVPVAELAAVSHAA